MNFKDARYKAQQSHKFALSMAGLASTWIMPLIPAYFVAAGVTERLMIHPLLAWPMAVGLELVGIRALEQAVHAIVERFKGIPGWVPMVCAGVYVLNLIVLAIVLDILPEGLSRAPIALLCFMTVVSAVANGVEGEAYKAEELEREEIEEKRRVADERRERNHEIKVLKSVQPTVQSSVQLNSSTTGNEQSVEQRREQLLNILAEHGDVGATEFAKRLKVGSRTTVYNDLNALNDAGVIHKNGNGWEVGPASSGHQITGDSK